MYTFYVLQMIRTLYLRFGFCWVVSISILVVISLTSCNGKQSQDQEWVDSVLRACDSQPEDSLVYEIEQEVLSDAVDENFNDFIYTFTHNGEFQLERLQLPLKMMGESGEPLRVIRNTTEFREEFNPSSKDYYVMLVSDISSMEEDYGSTAREAQLDLIDLHKRQVREFGYARPDGKWTLKTAHVISFDNHSMSSFLDFYQHFVTDSVYQIAHIAEPLMISMPGEDDDVELIEGTIDPCQFPVFAPELPDGQFMVLDYNKEALNAKRIVMIKCGMASSMMNILTFEQDGGVWRLISLEE